MEQIIIQLDKELKKEFKTIAIEQETDITKITRSLIQNYVKKHKGKDNK